MIPALATIVAAYCVVRLLLEVHKPGCGAGEATFRWVLTVGAIAVIASAWLAIQHAGSSFNYPPSSLMP